MLKENDIKAEPPTNVLKRRILGRMHWQVKEVKKQHTTAIEKILRKTCSMHVKTGQENNLLSRKI